MNVGKITPTPPPSISLSLSFRFFFYSSKFIQMICILNNIIKKAAAEMKVLISQFDMSFTSIFF